MQNSNPGSFSTPQIPAVHTLFTKWYMMLFVPLLIALWALALRKARGPFWSGGDYDPAYQYLLNSLSLSQGLPSGYADHPGATLQWLGAILLYFSKFFTGKDDLVQDVLTRPEFYLSIMHNVLVVILFLSLTISGLLILKWFNDPVAALLVQLGIFISYAARIRLSNMTPEPLLLILGIWLTMIVLYHAYQIQQESRKEPVWQYGVIAGLGLALKINFTPIMILPLILLRGLYRRFIYLGVSVAVFLVLAANPLMNHEKFTSFLTQLIARKGYNRPIEPASSKFQAMIDGFYRLMLSFWNTEKPLMIVISAFLVIGILFLLVKKETTNSIDKIFYKRLWFGLLLALSAQIILVANGPKAHIRYMIPFFALVGLMVFILWRWPISSLYQNSKAKFQYKAFFLIMIAVISIFVSLGLPGELKKINKDTEEWHEAYRFKKEHHLLNEPIVYHYSASDMQFALTFGNNWTKGHFAKQLSSLYPNVYYYSIFNEFLFKDFGTQSITLFDLFREVNTVMVQGGKDRYVKLIDPQENNNLIETEVIFDGSAEKITLLRPSPRLLLFLMNKNN